MNAKNMAKALNAKLNNWCKHIDDKDIVKTIEENAIVTGGALVSLLNSEKPNDYDVYFKTKESAKKVAEYYAKKWNENHDTKVFIVDGDDEEAIKSADFIEANHKNLIYPGRIQCFVQSAGVVGENNENTIDDDSEPIEEDIEQVVEDVISEKPRYRPRYFSTNAISLSDDIQLVIRFFGSVDEIHENYDFVHCTCSYDYKENKVILPVNALESIINKELYYVGSKYPLCSIIRSRKFITRGWTINAGQYLKMALQLNELDLKNLKVFRDQLVGVDSAYFNKAIEMVIKKQEKDPEYKIDNTYLFEVINRIF